MTLLRILESVHGHLGVLAAVALLHPAILLRKGLPLSRGARWSVGLTTLVTAAAFALGIGLYGSYRAHVKRDLFVVSREAGLLFETKEHLAFAVLCLALGAGIAALAAPLRSRELRRAAAAMYLAAAIACAAVVALGTYVSSVRTFPS